MRVRWVPVVVACWLAVGPRLAGAAPDPGAACQGAELQAAGVFLAKSFACWAAFHKNPLADLDGSARREPCRGKAEAKLFVTFDRAITKAGAGVCGVEDAQALLDDLALEVDTLSFAVSSAAPLGLPGPDTALHSKLHKAIGRALGGALKAEAKNAKQPNEVRRLAKREKLRAALLAAFDAALAKAAAAGVVYQGLAPADVADEVDRIVDALVGRTAPAGSTFTLAGTLFVSAGSLSDSDVNDTNTVPVSNDTPGAAQPLDVPAVLGGYVNLPGAGEAGNSFAAGDPVDWFAVSLATGQRVHLRMGKTPPDADLDLCLYDAADPLTPLDCSLGVAETEELVTTSAGDFLVEVRAFATCDCASTYVLTLGQTLSSTGANGVRLSDEFRPGEAVVTLAPSALPLAGPAPRAKAYEARFALSALGGAADREMLFRLPEASGARAASFGALGAEAARAALHARFPALDAARREKLDTLVLLKALARRADVALAEPNYVLRAQAIPNDPFFGLQWHYPLINLPSAWDVTTGSAAVKVAVIDTGVLLAHPDLQGQLTSGFDFISNPAIAADGNGIDANADDPGDGGGGPSSFHGTHVAGTIGATSNNGIGVAGVAQNVTLIPLRVLGIGGGTNFDILQAVRYAAGLANDSGTSEKADVMNLSLGGGGFSSVAQDVFSQARDAGVVVVAAAGNDNSSQLFFPASYDGVVSVSAVDLRRQKAPYSNFGIAVDVAAPGGDTSVDRDGDGFVDGVLSTLKNEQNGAFNFVFYQGTSMATPHVAGVVALMKAVDPTLTPAELDALLAAGTITDDLGAAGRDDVFGHGLIDAQDAVVAVSAPPAEDPVLVVNPTGLNFGATSTAASFEVWNGGSGSLTVTSVTETEPWLSVAPGDVDGSGLGRYDVTVDRTGLPAGTFSGGIEVVSSAGTEDVFVLMTVVATTPGADAGLHYVLLVDPVTFDTVAQAETVVSGGTYTYQLADVPFGTYLLYAGSDPDNDFFICGGAEACGAFPTLGTPETLEVTSDEAGLDFVTGFQQTIGTTSAGGGTGAEPGLRRMRVRGLASPSAR